MPGRFQPELDRAAIAPENVFAATLIAVATALFVLALSLYVRDGVAALLPLAVLAAAGVGFACFYAYERRSAVPLIPRVVYTPALVRSCAAGLGLLGGVAGLMYVSSLYMQDALGFSAARTGVSMLPYAFAVILSGHFLPKLLTRMPARVAAICGFAVNIVGILLLVVAAGQARYGVFMYAGLIIAPIGSLSGFLATISEATAAASPEQQGLTSAALFMAHQIGIALGGTTCLAVATALEGAGTRGLPYVGAYLAAAALPLLGMLALWAPSRGPMIRAPA